MTKYLDTFFEQEHLMELQGYRLQVFASGEAFLPRCWNRSTEYYADSPRETQRHTVGNTNALLNTSPIILTLTPCAQRAMHVPFFVSMWRVTITRQQIMPTYFSATQQMNASLWWIHWCILGNFPQKSCWHSSNAADRDKALRVSSMNICQAMSTIGKMPPSVWLTTERASAVRR